MSEEREYTFYRGHALLHGFREVFPVRVSGRGNSFDRVVMLSSYKGIAAELGLLVKVRKMALSLGVITIKGEYWEPTVGVGINF